MKALTSASLKTGGATLASIALGVLTTKILALLLGPAGTGFYSLLRQFQQTAVCLGSLNSQAAIVQGIAGARDEAEARRALGAAIAIVGAFGVAALIGGLAAAPLIAGTIFSPAGEAEQAAVRWLALAVLPGIGLVLVNGALNARGEIGALALSQVCGALAMLLFAYPLARQAAAGDAWPLPLLIASGAWAAFAWSAWVALRRRAATVRWADIRAGWSSGPAGNFLALAGSMLASGMIATAALLWVRASIAGRHGLEGAGVFDAAWTVGMAYIGLALSAFGTYYMPELAKRDAAARRALVEETMLWTIALIVPLIAAMMALAPLVISSLYSEAFADAGPLLRWMLIGDYFKAGAWVLSYLAVAQRNLRPLFWGEVLWSLGFAAFVAVHAGESDAFNGIGMAFAALYAAYFAGYLAFGYLKHGIRFGQRLVGAWAAGLGVLAAVAALNWGAASVDAATALACVAAACLFSLAARRFGSRR